MTTDSSRSAEAPSLSVILPTHNDAYRIIATLGALTHYLANIGLPWHVIVCDMESGDGTPELMAGMQLPHFTLLHVSGKGSKQDAICAGLGVCTSRYVMIADAGWGDLRTRSNDTLDTPWALTASLLETDC